MAFGSHVLVKGRRQNLGHVCPSWRLVILAALLVIGLLAGGCGDDSDDESADSGGQQQATDSKFDFKPEESSVKIAYGFIDPTSLPLKLAQDLGLYEKYGLDVELVQVATDGQAVQSLANGAVQAASVGSAILPSTTRSGKPAVMVAPTQSIAFDMLVGTSDISDPQDLVGKKIAIGVIGDDTHLSVVLALKELGISPDDVTLVQAGNEPERLAALQAGSVEAAPIDQSLKPRLEKEGFNILLELADAGVRTPRHGLAVSKEFMQENPGTTQALVAAYFEAEQKMFDDTNAAIESFADWAQMDQGEARDSVRAVLPFMEQGNQRCMQQKAEWWERMSDALGTIEPDLADVDTRPLWTTEFVDKLIDDGFATEVGAPC